MPKQGLKRSVVTDAGGIPLGAVPAPASRRDDGLLAATLDTVKVVGVLPAWPLVHLDAGYDYQPWRQVLAERGMLRSRAPVRPWSCSDWLTVVRAGSLARALGESSQPRTSNRPFYG